jgi:hypothetical protein
MGYYQIFSKSNTTVATSGAGTSPPSGALKRTIWFVLLNLWLGLFMFCGLSDYMFCTNIRKQTEIK